MWTFFFAKFCRYWYFKFCCVVQQLDKNCFNKIIYHGITVGKKKNSSTCADMNTRSIDMTLDGTGHVHLISRDDVDIDVLEKYRI